MNFRQIAPHILFQAALAILFFSTARPALAQFEPPRSYSIDIDNGQMVGLFNPTIPNSPLVGSLSQPHLANVWVHFIFWGDYWNTTPPPIRSASLYYGAYSNICSPANGSDTLPPPDFLSEMAQYGFESLTLGGFQIIPAGVTADMVTNAPSWMNAYMAGGLIPGPPNSNYQTLYVVVPPPGLVGGGYHGWTAIPSASSATKPLNATVNDVSIAVISDNSTSIFSHELVESISDPLANLQGDWALGALELADLPNSGQDNLLNGVEVQAYWLNNFMSTGIPYGPANEVAGNGLASYFDGNAIHAFYIGTDEHIHEIYWTGTAWTYRDLMTQPGTNGALSPIAPTALTCVYESDRGVGHVFYNGSDRLVHELYSVSGNWFIGAPNGPQSAPVLSLPELRSLSALYNTNDDTVHVFYHQRTDDNGETIAELYAGSTGNWQERFVTFDPAEETQFSALFDRSGVEHVFYININGHIKEAQWNGTQWVTNDWTTLSKDPNIVNFMTEPIGHLDGVACYDDGLAIHVFYIGNDSCVHEISRTDFAPTRYVHFNISSLGKNTTAAGQGLAAYYDSTAHLGHVINIDSNGFVDEFHGTSANLKGTYAESWKPFTNLSAGFLPAAQWTRSLTACYDPVHATQYIFSPIEVTGTPWSNIKAFSNANNGTWSTSDPLGANVGLGSDPFAFP